MSFQENLSYPRFYFFTVQDTKDTDLQTLWLEFCHIGQIISSQNPKDFPIGQLDDNPAAANTPWSIWS